MNISYNGNSGLYSGNNVTDLTLGETSPEHVVITVCFPVSESTTSPACIRIIAGLYVYVAIIQVQVCSYLLNIENY